MVEKKQENQMTIFLSKEKQKYSQPILCFGLWFLPEEKDLNIITCDYSNNCIEYYLFNKIKIWKKRT